MDLECYQIDSGGHYSLLLHRQAVMVSPATCAREYTGLHATELVKVSSDTATKTPTTAGQVPLLSMAATSYCCKGSRTHLQEKQQCFEQNHEEREISPATSRIYLVQ